MIVLSALHLLTHIHCHCSLFSSPIQLLHPRRILYLHHPLLTIKEDNKTVVTSGAKSYQPVFYEKVFSYPTPRCSMQRTWHFNISLILAWRVKVNQVCYVFCISLVYQSVVLCNWAVTTMGSSVLNCSITSGIKQK